MNIILFILRLVRRFVDVDPVEFSSIQSDANSWYEKISIHDSKDVKKDAKYYVKLYGERWYSKLFLAVAFIFSVKAIQQWMNPEESEEEKDKF